jgi:penicillin-binding protein 2
MFERRLKILLGVLLVATGALAIRAGQIQIVQREHWGEQAVKLSKSEEDIETTRGTLFDRKGRALAQDAPCVDAAVDFQAILAEPDSEWLEKRADLNLKQRLSPDEYKAAKRSGELTDLKSAECNRLRADIAAMWQGLAAVGGKTPEEIDAIRRDIVQRVEMRKRYQWWRNYQRAEDGAKGKGISAWYRKYLLDSAPDEEPEDNFWLEMGEETEPHVILHQVSTAVQVRLAREQDRFFCLSLVPSKYRQYPFGRGGSNLLGYLQTARPDEIAADVNVKDPGIEAYWTQEAERFWTPEVLQKYGVEEFHELRKYLPADLVGRTGLEALCENTLRGTRGTIESVSGTEQVLDRIDAAPGRNVTSSIDIDLQQDCENELVKTRVIRNRSTGQVEDTRFNQHGAIVVLDVDTNQVLAMASNPGYDPNQLDVNYPQWSADELNEPMLNRATQIAVEPGSTVKPILGSGAITDGVMKPTDKIKCQGELMIDGKPQPHGRCWIYALCKQNGLPISHGPLGADDPLIGPDDMLTITDGIRDSCNVVFENVALRMGTVKLSTWFDHFGLGRRTGIGIEENPGLVYHPSPGMETLSLFQSYTMGIGEGYVHATPIQMANVAATIARNGIWMRPRLVADADMGRIGEPTGADRGDEQVDLHISPDALAAVQKGMQQVCSKYMTGYMILPESNDGGPGELPLDQDPLRGVAIAGKTGSAQVGVYLSVADHSPGVHPALKEVHFGDPGTAGWYLMPSVAPEELHPEHHLAHAWFIGYAPADHPRVAFCVFVEYGNAGNPVAGPIAHDVLVDCAKRGYLSAAK